MFEWMNVRLLKRVLRHYNGAGKVISAVHLASVLILNNLSFVRPAVCMLNIISCRHCQVLLTTKDQMVARLHVFFQVGCIPTVHILLLHLEFQLLHSFTSPS